MDQSQLQGGPISKNKIKVKYFNLNKIFLFAGTGPVTALSPPLLFLPLFFSGTTFYFKLWNNN
jgi:hypothetical protein